jgi:hypothetical protein
MLAHNPRLSYYVFYNLGLRTQSATLTELEHSSTAFDAAPLWLDAAGDWDKGTAEKCIMVFDVLFMAMYASLAVLYFWRFLRCLCSTGCQRSRCGLPGIWFFLDAVIILVSVLLTVMYVYCIELTRGLIQLVGQLPAFSVGQTYTSEQLAQIVLERAGLDMPQYMQRLDSVLEQATLLQQGQVAFPWFVAVLAICLCLRPFRAFRWSPRFVVLQKTVSVAISDLVHSLFVVAVLFIGFALVGYIIFGTRSRLFSTIGDSLNSTFLFLWGFALDRHRERLFEASGAALTSLAVLWAIALNVVIALMLLKVFAAALVHAHLALMGEPGIAEPPAFLPKSLNNLLPARSSKHDKAAPGPSEGAAGPAQAAPGASDGAAGSAQAAPVTSDKAAGAGSLLSGSIDDRILQALEKLTPAERAQVLVPLATAPAERARLEELMALAAKSGDTGRRHPALHNVAHLCAHTEGSVHQLEALSSELAARSHGLVDERTTLLAFNDAACGPGPEEANLASAPFFDSQPLEAAQEAASDASATSSPKAGAALALPQDSPEPEPTTASPHPQLELMRSQVLQQQAQQRQLYNLMEDRLSQASVAQDKRFERLEESIVRLGKRLEPMLHEGGSHDVKVDPGRIEFLEEKVRKLMSTLAPILDLEHPLEHPLVVQRESEQRELEQHGRERRRGMSTSRLSSRMSSRMPSRVSSPQGSVASSRAGSPPRTLIAAAPSKPRPRARSSTPAMWSSHVTTPAPSVARNF